MALTDGRVPAGKADERARRVLPLRGGPAAAQLEIPRLITVGFPVIFYMLFLGNHTPGPVDRRHGAVAGRT